MLSPLPDCVKTIIDYGLGAEDPVRSQEGSLSEHYLGKSLSEMRMKPPVGRCGRARYRSIYYLLKKGAVCDEDVTKQRI